MILTRVRDFIGEYEMISHGDKVLAAVSGGSDSVAMLHILMSLSQNMGFSLEAAHFNHCLRGEESDRDERFTVNLCHSLSIPVHTARGDVVAYARENSLGTEEAARIMRYAFLEKKAAEIGAGRIATAHNADDNAETVIFNLTRGSGMRGLMGIPPVRGKIIRPVMVLTRQEIESYLNEHRLGHVEDSTNAQNDYTRNKLRHFVMPVLRIINPNVSGVIMKSKQMLENDEDFLYKTAEKFVVENVADNCVSAKRLSELHPAIFSRVVRIICPGATGEHVEAVKSLCTCEKASAKADIPNMRVVREYDAVTFGIEREYERIDTRLLTADTEIIVPEIGKKLRVYEAKNLGKVYKTLNTFLFKKTSICGTILLRSRKQGDTVNLSDCTKTLKKLFIEKHIPSSQRELIPVFADENGVIAVYGLGTDRRVRATEGDDVIIIEFEELT